MKCLHSVSTLLSSIATASLMVCFSSSNAIAEERQQEKAAIAESYFTEAPLQLGRGVNVLGYDPIWYDFGKARFKEKYFSQISQVGFDHIRLNLHPFRHMSKDENGAWDMSEKWYSTLDWIVDNALRNDLKIILDLHEYDPLSQNPEGLKSQYIAFWEKISEKYANYSNRVIFEILNEPHDKLDAKLWDAYMHEALAIIRAKNPERPVIVGPTGWNSIDKLDTLNLPVDDPRIIVTVHYYLPMNFTHQGASWVNDDRIKNTTGVPWGTDEEKAAVHGHFDKVQEWSKANNRIVYLGEFGAYDKGEFKYRVLYTDYVCRTIEEMGWSWGYWQFDSDFIVYDVPNDKWVEPILKALIPGAEPKY